VHAIEPYGGEKLQPHSFLISLLDGVIYPLRASAALPSGKQLLQSLNRSWAGLSAGLDSLEFFFSLALHNP